MSRLLAIHCPPSPGEWDRWTTFGSDCQQCFENSMVVALCVCLCWVVVTCWDRMVTASLCLASRRLMLLTARMASPTCRPPHLSAGWLGWISEMRMGTPCSFPPWSEHTQEFSVHLTSSQCSDTISPSECERLRHSIFVFQQHPIPLKLCTTHSYACN